MATPEEILGDIRELDAEIRKLETDRQSGTIDQAGRISLDAKITAITNRITAKTVLLTALITSQQVPTIDVKGKLSTLLRSRKIDVEEAVLSIIVESPWLSSRAICSNTAGEALSIYEAAQRIPRTKTRAVAMEQGVKIDVELQFEGPQTASFFRAFENAKESRVFKVNQTASKTENECRLYAEIGNDAMALVPVRMLTLDRSSTHQSISTRPLRPFQGILMPSYSHTLRDLPNGIPYWYATELFITLAPAIDYIHEHKWFHGDVKSANIFCECQGTPWLGDYGSSVKYDALSSFTGGTPWYQCVDIDHVQSPRLFDRVGLVLSLLEKLGVIELRDDQQLDHVRLAIDALRGENASKLQDLFRNWILPCGVLSMS